MKKFFFVVFILSPFLLTAQVYRSEVIKSSIHFVLKGDNLSKIDTTVIQINERMGDHDTHIAEIYQKGDKVSIEKAWIEDMVGNMIRKLKNNEIEDQSYIRDVAFYSDTYIKHFQLKHNTYPYRICYILKHSFGRNTNIWDSDYTGRKQPVNNRNIIVETNLDQPLKYKQENIAPPQIDTLPKTVRYRWNINYTPLKNEVNASINTSIAPKLTILPTNFKFGERGSWDSWQSFGNWLFRLNSKKGDLPESEKNIIDGLIQGIADDREKARSLYHYLQDNHRYINVSIKTGGLESHPASYVCSNRYGDCKALSNYMKTALEYIGIKAYYTLVNFSDQITDIDVRFPSHMFNHVILTVPFGNDTTYLECTSKTLPFGYVHSGIQGRKALMITENDSKFTNIPSTTPEEVMCTRTFDIQIRESGHSLINFVADEKGSNFEWITSLSTETNKNTVDKYMRNTILSGSYELQDFRFEKADRDSNNICTHASIKITNLIKKYGNNILLSPFPLEIPLYEKPGIRKQNIQLDIPEYYIDTIKYHLPEGINITKIPKDINIDSSYGTYSLSFEKQDNILIVKKKLLIPSGRYTLSQYRDFYDFINSVRQSENQKLNIEIQ